MVTRHDTREAPTELEKRENRRPILPSKWLVRILAGGVVVINRPYGTGNQLAVYQAGTDRRNGGTVGKICHN